MRDPDEIYDSYVEECQQDGRDYRKLPPRVVPAFPPADENARIDREAEERENRESDERVARALAEQRFGDLAAAVFELGAITARAQVAARRSGL